MQLSEAVGLIQTIKIHDTVPQVWADLGCGAGLFTRALAKILPEGSTIYGVDKLNNLSNKNIVGRSIIFHQADFEKDEWTLPKLDGILMANSLHFVREQKLFINQLRQHLHPKEDRSFIFIEYDMDTPNRWVPYPLSFNTLKQLLESIQLPALQKLGEIKSIYQLAKIYSSQLIVPKKI